MEIRKHLELDVNENMIWDVRDIAKAVLKLLYITFAHIKFKIQLKWTNSYKNTT